MEQQTSEQREHSNDVAAAKLEAFALDHEAEPFDQDKYFDLLDQLQQIETTEQTGD